MHATMACIGTRIAAPTIAIVIPIATVTGIY